MRTLPKHKCFIKEVSQLYIPNPEYGDMKLNVFPFSTITLETSNRPILPQEFSLWEDTLERICMKHIPYVSAESSTHYVTIDSKFFPTDDFLRREGVHIDGNLCVDPTFQGATWGGASWSGGTAQPIPTEPTPIISDPLPEEETFRVIVPWASPYGTKIPIGTYVSDSLGGIFCVSSEVGCRGWQGTFEGYVGSEGDFSNMGEQITPDKEVLFEKDKLYFMSSNTPHETLLIKKGTRRTFMRITLNHNYPNSELKL